MLSRNIPINCIPRVSTSHQGLARKPLSQLWRWAPKKSLPWPQSLGTALGKAIPVASGFLLGFPLLTIHLPVWPVDAYGHSSRAHTHIHAHSVADTYRHTDIWCIDMHCSLKPGSACSAFITCKIRQNTDQPDELLHVHLRASQLWCRWWYRNDLSTWSCVQLICCLFWSILKCWTRVDHIHFELHLECCRLLFL